MNITDGSNFGVGNLYLQNLPPGTYVFDITDDSCTVTKVISLPCGFNSGNLTVTATSSQCDSATGTATVQSFIGGVPPFTYSWQTIPIQTTQTATGLAGLAYYTVTVYDSNNDSASTGAYVPVNSIIASATYTPTLCNDSTGTATANGAGGVAPYTYLWSTIPTQTTQTIINLANTVYTVTVSDAHGCTDAETFLLPNSVAMTVGIYSTPETCLQANGTAITNVTGGTAPYTYL